MNGRKLVFYAVMACAALLVGRADATLIGGTVRAQYATDSGSGLNLVGSPDVIGPITADASDVGSILLSQFTVDFNETSFSLSVTGSSFSSLDFNGFRFDEFGWQDAPRIITGVSVTDNIDGFDASNVSYTADEIFVNFSGLYSGEGNSGEGIVDVIISTQVIPEPASIGLLGLVSGGIYFSRRFFRI